MMHFAEFGVVMMLFCCGRLRVPILGLGGLQVAVTTLVVAIISFILGFPGKWLWRLA